MFEFTVTGKELQKQYHVSYSIVRLNVLYKLHTSNDELCQIIKNIAIKCVDGSVYPSLQIIKHEELVYCYDRFAEKVVITITVDNEEIAMYLKLKYFS